MKINDLKVLFDDKLHDANIYCIKYDGLDLEMKISTKGMDINKYFKDIEEINFTMRCFDVTNLKFDFDSEILINNFDIKPAGDRLMIKVNDNDLYLECKDYSLIDIRSDSNKKDNNLLEELLKSNI